MKIPPLTAEINRRFERTYSEGLIGIDLGVLTVIKGWVEIDKKEGLSLTEYGRTVDTSSLSRKPRCVESQQGELMAA